MRCKALDVPQCEHCKRRATPQGACYGQQKWATYYCTGPMYEKFDTCKDGKPQFRASCPVCRRASLGAVCRRMQERRRQIEKRNLPSGVAGISDGLPSACETTKDFKSLCAHQGAEHHWPEVGPSFMRRQTAQERIYFVCMKDKVGLRTAAVCEIRWASQVRDWLSMCRVSRWATRCLTCGYPFISSESSGLVPARESIANVKKLRCRSGAEMHASLSTALARRTEPWRTQQVWRKPMV